MTGSLLLAADRFICLDAASSEADWLVVEDGRIKDLGRGSPPGDAVRLPGTVLPGLIDAHVHLTTTGLYRSGLDMRECRTVDELLDVLRAGIRNDDSWVIAGNFDPGRNTDRRMPSRLELDEIAPSQRVLVSRADGHSCAVNSPALEVLDLDPSLPGIDLGEDGAPSGILANKANYTARAKFFSALPEDKVKNAQLSGCRLALQRGVTSVHEMAGGSFMGDRDFDILVASLPDLPIHVRPYLATFDIPRVLNAGLDCVGGDLFLDGSIGSKTAAMTGPYEDGSGNGTLYHSDEDLIDWFVEATRAGVQAGVHAIGDAAVEQALRCLEEAATVTGSMSSALRHRIEHFECVSVSQLERALRLGIVASVQPMFDAYWGGPDGMYAERLGERHRTMNPFSLMVEFGLTVAGGSDSTVTPLDPFLGIAAAMGHHETRFRVNCETALRMFSIWAAQAGLEESDRGSIEIGKCADFCVVAKDPRDLSPEEVSALEVRDTWVAGVSLHNLREGA